MLWKLYAAFFRVGLFTFGGGYSMLPMLERETVEKNHWTTREELLDFFAIGQCVPGIIAVNAATMLGHKIKKIPGALVAMLGAVTPSLIVIMLVALVLTNIAHIPIVAHAFAGIRVGVCALLTSAVVRLFKSNVLAKRNDGETIGRRLKKSLLPMVIALVAFILVAFVNASPIYAIVGAALTGILFMQKRGD